MREDSAGPDRQKLDASRTSGSEIESSLRDLGLGGNAAVTFAALVRAPEATAGDLVSQTGIPDSKIYYALEELAERGLVDVQIGKPKRFRAVPQSELGPRLERLVEERSERERATARRIVQLAEPMRSAAISAPAQIALVVKGRAGVTGRARSLLASARREVVLMSSDERLLRELQPELQAAAQRRVRLRIAARQGDVDPALVRRAEFREIKCACVALIVDGAQVLTANSLKEGSAYGIVSTDETLVRIARDYWDSPNCCEC